jgi:hypothetical protein
MKRMILAVAFALGCWSIAASAADAQIFVRAPFVRVQVGPGVWVRAPFVNLFVPPAGGTYVVPSGNVAPAGEVLPLPSVVIPPAVNDPKLPPPPAPLPAQAEPAMKLDQFAKSFQAKAGSYEVDLVNPVTNQPTRVRFTLPDGTPKRVEVRDNELEFRYGPLRFVRIQFDKDGAQVLSR